MLEEEDEDETNDVEVQVENVPVESLKYLILLIRNLNNKINISDLKEYKDLLINF
jgi:hypothetical protein